MIKQKLQNIFKKSINKKKVIETHFILANAITMQASSNWGRLKIS